jgi:hypothetical protein
MVNNDFWDWFNLDREFGKQFTLEDVFKAGQQHIINKIATCGNCGRDDDYKLGCNLPRGMNFCCAWTYPVKVEE